MVNDGNRSDYQNARNLYANPIKYANSHDKKVDPDKLLELDGNSIINGRQLLNKSKT